MSVARHDIETADENRGIDVARVRDAALEEAAQFLESRAVTFESDEIVRQLSGRNAIECRAIARLVRGEAAAIRRLKGG